MNKVSAVIITYNEERVIGGCLASLTHIFDDIVIVDSYSTDNTKKICQSFTNVNFISHEWLGFAAQKNIANTFAKNDWIFSIDADEVISPELSKSIQSNINSGLKGVYSCKRLTNYCGKWIKHCGWYPDTKTRLFNKKEASWEGIIHEELNHKQSETLLNGNLLHYSFHSIEQHVAQVNKFSSLKAGVMLQKNKKASGLKAFSSSIVKFFSCYFFKLGFLDGFYGLVISYISAMSNFIKYAKLKQLQNSNNE